TGAHLADRHVRGGRVLGTGGARQRDPGVREGLHRQTGAVVAARTLSTPDVGLAELGHRPVERSLAGARRGRGPAAGGAATRGAAARGAPPGGTATAGGATAGRTVAAGGATAGGTRVGRTTTGGAAARARAAPRRARTRRAAPGRARVLPGGPVV